MHKIIIPLATLSYEDASHMRVYIEEAFGFSRLGFRFQTIVPHRFFKHFSCMTLENQRCLAEMLEFQFGRNRCAELVLYTKPDEREENAFLVTRKYIGHVLVYSFGSLF